MARAFGHLLAALNTIATLLIFFLIVLICSDVIGRAAFRSPIPGVPEIIKFSIVAMVWLQMAYALRSGVHLRTTLVLSILSRFNQQAVLVANAIMGIGLFAAIAWLGWDEMVKSWEIGAFEGEHPARIPVAPIWGILVLGSALTAIQFALDAVRVVREGPSGTDAPHIAVQ